MVQLLNVLSERIVAANMVAGLELECSLGNEWLVSVHIPIQHLEIGRHGPQASRVPENPSQAAEKAHE